MKACIEPEDLPPNEDHFLLLINLHHQAFRFSFPDLGIEGLQWLVAKDPFMILSIRTIIFEIFF